eukprot:Opistho-2@49948
MAAMELSTPSVLKSQFSEGGPSTKMTGELEVLPYAIDSWSSHSAQYHPDNILVNKPTEQSSRWSSGSNNQMQFVSLKLDKVSIVHTITFGKYHKVHVCNLKEFKVFGGLEHNNMIELLHSGLRNDSEPETFPLKHKTNGVAFPCKYIKIVPLMAWGANFNFSIWFVQLNGIADQATVVGIKQDYDAYREREAIRLCLKHFRQRNYLDTFETLQKRTKICLEHPSLTELHERLVINGDFEHCERILTSAAKEGLFSEHIADCKYTPLWQRLSPLNRDGQASAEAPGMRGGHQMCIDVEGGIVYLIGGWDGQKDLADMWAYNIADNQWSLLSEDTGDQGGPGPRSCHKICFDDRRRRIYTLGRYVDPESRGSCNLKSDFYRYDIDSGTWTLISADTAEQAGPDLIYDHQMCLDPVSETLYVFGGRTISSKASDNIYSGLYGFHCPTGVWTLIRSDSNQPANAIQLKSRIGHSMLFNPEQRQLYIFAGQRNKDYLSDFYIYNVDSGVVVEMSRDSSKQGGPDAGFTQRATIDTELGEFYVLSGLMREKSTSVETVKNAFWVYNIAKDKWARVYQNENVDQEYWSRMQNVEPCPRFAHQLVYDHKNKVHYLFGGNPGEMGNPKMRLDDFWALRLERPSAENILKRSLFLIRRQKFQEMCKIDSMDALRFLQHDLAATVNHNDASESAEFRHLTSTLFQRKGTAAAQAALENGVDQFSQRTRLYEDLLLFFPESMKQPRGSLVDLLTL